MADDNGQEPERISALIPVSLMQALTTGMLRSLREWHDEQGLDMMDVDKCFLAMIASVEVTMGLINDEAPHMTLQ